MYGELALINVSSVYVGCVRAADSVVGAVSTDAVLVNSVGRSNYESLDGLVVGVVLCGSLGNESNASLTLGCLTGSTLVGADIGLGLALEEVESVTKKSSSVLSKYLLEVYVGSLIHLRSGCKVVILICNVACEVESLTEGCLEENKLEGLICLGSYNVRNEEICGRSKELDLVGLFNVGCTLAASLNGDSYGGGLLGKSYGKLAVCYYSVVAVGAPSEANLGICSAGKRKCDLACLLNGLGKLNLGKRDIDLLVGSSLNLLEILEGSCGYGADVDSVAIYVNNTGDVCKIISLCKMISEYCSLLLSGHNANGKVGGVNSEVGLKSALELEVEVLSLFAKILLADNYALDGYEHTELISECLSLRIGISLCKLGDIGRSELGDGAIGDGNGSILDLVSLTVNLLDTGNGYLHTNLKTVFLNVVLGGVVYVVTAVAAQILNEELVTGVACALRTSESYDTLDGYGVAGNLLKILLEGEELVLGNLSLEGNGCARAVGSIDGCGNGVNKVLGCLLVNVDRNVIFVNDYLNEFGAGSPGYGVSNLFDEYLLNNRVVGGGLVGSLYVKLIDIILSSLYVVLNLLNGGFFGGLVLGELDAKPTANGLLNVIDNAPSLILDLVNRASRKAGEYEYHNEN